MVSSLKFTRSCWITGRAVPEIGGTTLHARGWFPSPSSTRLQLLLDLKDILGQSILVDLLTFFTIGKTPHRRLSRIRNHWLASWFGIFEIRWVWMISTLKLWWYPKAKNSTSLPWLGFNCNLLRFLYLWKCLLYIDVANMFGFYSSIRCRIKSWTA